jgi:hypothetical protein
MNQTPSRTRSSVMFSLILFAVLSVLNIFLVVRDYLAGQVTIWLPLLSRKTLLKSANLDDFHFWTAVNVLIAVMAVVVASGGFLLLHSKRAAVFQNTFVAVQNYFAPSGMTPLWVGLLIAVVAFVIYVVVA